MFVSLNSKKKEVGLKLNISRHALLLGALKQDDKKVYLFYTKKE